MYSEERLNRFLDDLASGAPTPGGGGVAAAIGAMGAALVSMVANFTAGRAKFAEMDAEARAVLERSEGLRGRLVDLIETDIDAFTAVSAAYKLPRDTDERKAERTAAIQVALIVATEAPLEVMAAARRTLDLCQRIAEFGNPTVISDAGVAALAANAALLGADLNVEINLKSIKDASQRDRLSASREELLAGVAACVERVLATTRERM